MKNHLVISLVIGAILAVNASANTNYEEQQEEVFEAALNLVEGAAQESIYTLERYKGGGNWKLPDWIKKAAEKQEKRRKQMLELPEFPGWDEYDD